MGLLGGSRNSVQSSSASTPASCRHTNNHINYRHRRAESDVTDSSSTGSIDNASSDNSNTYSLKSTPPSLPRSQSLRRQSSQQFLRYECRDAQHFELREDPYYTTNANVKVMIRIRPLSADEILSNGYGRCIRQESAHSLTWLGNPETRFSFDHVASESVTQEEIFNVVGAPMVENCLAGYNSCMFAYGQTGSGKTHTILGDLEGVDCNPSEGRGLTPRIIEHLFARIQQDERINEGLKYSCKCSFLEIYNEQVTDLLEPTSTNLLVREDHKRGVYVENLSEVDVMSVQDAITLLRKGTANRKVAVTIMNKESSRSHSIFTCSVQCRNGSLNKTLYGHLHLVDLAGSERQKLSGAEGGRLKEATNINKSLSTLGLVIMNLVDIANGKQRHVPYRDSKLSFLLQDSLGGNSKTTVVANISPSICSAVETLSTLKFSQRAKFIRNAVVINEDTTEDISVMRAQIKLLKQELQHAQYLQKASFYSFATPPRRLNSLHYDFESPTDHTGNLESAYICNGGQTSSSASQVVSTTKCICESGECSSNCMWKIRSLESLVAGALRRELQAERLTKHLSTEIEYLQCLVQQREEETQCSRMLLRFREEKISKMESIATGSISSATVLSDENKALKEEVKLLRGRIDRNPELIRFAMENIKLIEQIRRYREFYEGGEREHFIEELSNLRDKLAELLDWKQQHELSSGKGMLDMVQMVSNVDKKSWNTWIMCGKTNTQMARHIDEIETHLSHLKRLFSEQQEVISMTKGEPEHPFEEQYKHIDAQSKLPYPSGFEMN